MVKKNKQSSSATSSSHAKRKQKSKTPKTKEQQETEDNKADFYLDDKDADLAYDSEELENEQSEHGSELDFDENDYVSSEHEDTSGDDDDDGKEKKPKKEKKLTRAELKKIINKCTSSGSLIDLTKLVIIFTKITNPNTLYESDDENEIPEKRNVLSDTKATSKIIKYCITNLPEILQLKLNDNVNNDKSSSSSSSYKQLAKRYLSILVRYIKTCETSMKHFIFANIDTLSSLIFIYNNFTEVFLKTAINIWAHNALDDIGNKCFNFIRNLITTKPNFFEHALKLFYINYLDIAKATNLTSYETILKLQRDIAQILHIDLQKAYLTIFTFIRKLCIQLRLTIIDKTSSSIKQIYNWQFVNALILWGRVVSMYSYNSDIQLLIYPLIQTIIGVIRLNYNEQFYLLRIRLVMLLNSISKHCGVYIPIAMYVLPILKSNYFIEKCKANNNNNKSNNSNNNNNNKSNNNKKTNQRVNVLVHLKIKKEEYQFKQIRKDLLEECCDCLVEHLSINANKICFEDLCFCILKEMRNALKNIYDKEYRMIIKNRVDKIEGNVMKLKELISNETMKINIIKGNTIEQFENEVLKKENEFIKEYENIRHKREANFEALFHQKENKFIEV